MQRVNFARMDFADLLAAETWQYDPVDHRAVVRHTSRALLRDGVLFKVIRREILHGGRGANGTVVRNRVVPFQSVRQGDPCPFVRLVEGKQRPVLADGPASGCACLSVPVLDDVAFHAGRFDPDTEPREFRIPYNVVRIGV